MSLFDWMRNGSSEESTPNPDEYEEIPSWRNSPPACPNCGGQVWYSSRYENYCCEDCFGYFNEDDLDLDCCDDDIPEGCLACGGPYPHCMSSCNLFDD